tara:strand:+ start:527 stop:667 length:141 start_codon:yes stop_codon:yes gene_type:complete
VNKTANHLLKFNQLSKVSVVAKVLHKKRKSSDKNKNGTNSIFEGKS